MPNKKKITYESEFQGKPIMTDKPAGLGCDQAILEAIHQQFSDMTERHNKTLFMRLDVRLPADRPSPEDNSAFCRFQSDFIKQLKRQGLDPHYVAVREQSREKHQHYHGILLLDGNKTQNIHGHIATAEAIWRRKLALPTTHEGDRDVPVECRQRQRGLIDDCTSDREGQPQENGIMLRRDDPEYEEKINRCFHWASYLAKENQKANTPEGQRQLFASRIKKK